MEAVIPGVLHHHERFDGSGYPEGLKGVAIPLHARIIAIADAFDALTTDRPYRKAIDRAAALEELERKGGTQFDPRLINVFRESIQGRGPARKA
jgi:HD-GYP domain-containing protein (c-di-GMP phosphodiesterase class II)